MDPLHGSRWSQPGTVASFVDSPPNHALLAFADAERRNGGTRAIDIGCGAGRNLLPLARQGWTIVGADLSAPMLAAASERIDAEGMTDRAHLELAPMDALPVADRSVELIVAHGVWNLARTDREFRGGLKEAARVARAGAGLFVFTFSRRTLPPSAPPVPGETLVFTGFSGDPQCFLTDRQLVAELAAVGFVPDPSVPLTELNAPRPGSIRTGSAPVIFEAAFRFTGQ